MNNERQNYIENEKIESVTPADEKSDLSLRQNKRDYNLQKDEMTGLTTQQFSLGRKDFHGVSPPPPWEELSDDEIRKLLDQRIHEDKYRPNADRWAEPLITREPYPINLPDYEKLVMNVSSSILQ